MAGLTWLWAATLLGGNLGLGLLGVCIHHGWVGGGLGIIVGVVGKWAHDLVLWYRARRGAEPVGWLGWWRRLTLGSIPSLMTGLTVPALGYLWGHGITAVSRVAAWCLVLVVFILFARYLRSKGQQLPRAWNAVPKALARLPRRSTMHVAWFAIAPAVPAPGLSLEELLETSPAFAGWKPRTESTRFIDAPYGGLRTAFTSARAAVLAATPELPNDVFLVRFGLSHEGEVARLVAVYNLSDTASVEEVDLTSWQKWLAWTVRHGERVQSVAVADLRGENEEDGGDWSRLERIQRGIANWQATGQWRGVGRSRLELREPAESVNLALADGVLKLGLGQTSSAFDLARVPTPEQLGAEFSFTATLPTRPGSFVTWAVDRLRAVPWIGSAGMQWVKGIAFRAGERLEAIEHEVVGIDADELIADELGSVLETLPLAQSGSIPGWPPQPVPGEIKPTLIGEGQWVSLASDLTVVDDADAPSPFVFTFVRTDPERAYIQTSITLWDPRRVELHVVAGTEEPKSMTGHTGSGLIPRDPAVLNRLVGAFNGAFQAVHGEFGMIEGGKVLLPPKPFGATVVERSDGSAGFGTWPLSVQVPAEVVGLRQNMTPLIVDDTINPYRRSWWGGVPEGWTDGTRTVRSGLCMTREGFMAYFYSPGIDPRGLARAMQLIRCQYGVHLDMNAGHTGFEFYRAAPAGALPSLDRALDASWEARGRVSGVVGYEFVSRLMVKKMPLMNFPRYIHLTPRDFFYLTRRALLPGAPLEPLSDGEPGDGKWRMLGVGDNDWPHLAAATGLNTKHGEVPAFFLVTRLDPRQVRVVGESSQASFGVSWPQTDGATPVWLSGRRAGIGPIGEKHTTIFGPGRLDLAAPGGVVCVDEDGFLVFIEKQGAPVPTNAYDPVLSQLSCLEKVFVPKPVRVVNPDAQGDSSVERVEVITWLARDTLTGAERIFTDTPIVSPDGWALAQRRRVDYPAPVEDSRERPTANP